MSNAMKQMQFDALNEMIVNRNALTAQINAAVGNKEDLADSIREQPQFETLRNQIAALEEELESQVKVLVDQALANSTDNSEELLNKVKEIDEALKPGITYFKKLYGEAEAEGLTKMDRVKGTRSGGGGTGGKRIRGYNWVITLTKADGTETVNEYENAANASKALGIETKMLQEQFFAKAGVEQIKDAPDEVILEGTFPDTDADGNTTEVKAKIRAYRTAPKPAEGESTEAPTSTEEPEAEVSPEDIDL